MRKLGVIFQERSFLCNGREGTLARISIYGLIAYALGTLTPKDVHLIPAVFSNSTKRDISRTVKDRGYVTTEC